MERREEKTKDIHVTRTAQPCPHADWIPFDLTREILLRLPSKSLMRFQCVSKLWASITSDPDFINSFPKLKRSCLILNFLKIDKQLFLSFPQQKNLGTMCVKKYRLTLKVHRYPPNFQFQSVHGLISFHYVHDVVVWNPSMRQYVTFRKPAKLITNVTAFSKSYLGYDPIGNTYKLLSMSYGSTDDPYVLTLGSRESWRQIKEDLPKLFFII
ncbi:putative F-box domain-containing protein [Arabidopsis thaliana]